MWRGTPHAEVADRARAGPEVARLRNPHLVALEARMTADLDLGTWPSRNTTCPGRPPPVSRCGPQPGLRDRRRG
ncbi:BTAD domain-containing putative transcriptional regulator [Pseudonocardia artemisiae]